MQCRGIYSIRPAPHNTPRAPHLNYCGPVHTHTCAAKGDTLSDKKAGTSATRLTRHVVALQGPCGASFYPSGSRRCRHCPARLDLCNMPRVAWLTHTDTRSVRKQSQAEADNPIFVAPLCTLATRHGCLVMASRAHAVRPGAQAGAHTRHICGTGLGDRITTHAARRAAAGPCGAPRLSTTRM